MGKNKNVKIIVKKLAIVVMIRVLIAIMLTLVKIITSTTINPYDSNKNMLMPI